MAIVLVNNKKLDLELRIGINESFTPNDEVKKLSDELAEIRSAWIANEKRLEQFLIKCRTWNINNDKAFKESVELKERNKKIVNDIESPSKVV